DDRVVHLDRLAAELERDRFAGGAGGLADLARDAGEQAPDRDHARTGDLAAQVAGEALDLGGVVAHAADDGGELPLDLGDVARDLAHAPRQDVEVVVTIELELVESVDGGWERAGGGSPGSMRLSPRRTSRPPRPVDPWIAGPSFAITP